MVFRLGGARRRISEMSYCKVCSLEDFSDPQLLPVIRDVFSHEIERFGTHFPQGREFRKHWEIAMAVRSLSDWGALHPRSEILGVGAGNEPTIFYLTNRVRRVFATDLYLNSGIWKDWAPSSMLTDPGSHWPFDWNPRRLVVQHMDALDLQYEDEAFDGIFSSSSIEHFGGLEGVARSLDEMFRVLKPGGILSISTEFRLQGPAPGIPQSLMFNAKELLEMVLEGRLWSLVSPMDSKITDATLQTEFVQNDLVPEFAEHLAKHGHFLYHDLDSAIWPQLVLRAGEHVFTSVHLALRKGKGNAPNRQRV